jgi:plastocyanin
MRTKIVFTMIVATALLAACGSKGSSYYAPAASTPVGSAPTDAPTSAPVPAGNETKVEISGFAFSPASVTVKVGDTVTWTNQDSASHTVALDDKSASSSSLAKGASFSFTFNTAGTFTYHCGFHSSMTGTVVVQP